MLWGAQADQAVYQQALTSHQQHADIHRYPVYVLRQQILDNYWSKPLWLLTVLAYELSKPSALRAEWLVWFDADTIIINEKIPFEMFLPPEQLGDIDFICNEDWNGLNNGVFFLRVNALTTELMAQVVAFPRFRPNENLVFADQSAMQLLFQEQQYRHRVAYMPRTWFNAYDNEAGPASLLVHFPGRPDRDILMASWYDKIQKLRLKNQATTIDPVWAQDVFDYWANRTQNKDEES